MGEGDAHLGYSRGHGYLIYYADHEPAHFHIRAAGFRAKMTIGELAIIEISGRMRPAEISTIRKWARAHRAELAANWTRAQRLEPLFKIED